MRRLCGALFAFGRGRSLMRLQDALEMVALSDSGVLRGHNEDAVFSDAALGVAILADGMGGYNAGEVASSMAVSRLSAELGSVIGSCLSETRHGRCDAAVIERHIVNEVGAANFDIFNASRGNPRYSGMGTTLVLAWFYDNRVSVAHVGDSRVYRLRGESFEQLTRDHSLLQERLDSGLISREEARHSDYKNLVTRALGVDPTVDVDISDFDVQPGDLVLLCSDGLNDMVDDHDIAHTLQALGRNLPLAAEHLIQLANDNGGRDNISVVLVRVLGDYAAPAGWWQRLLARLK